MLAASTMNGGHKVVNYEVYHDPPASTAATTTGAGAGAGAGRMNHSQSAEQLNDGSNRKFTLQLQLANPNGLQNKPSMQVGNTGSLMALSNVAASPSAIANTNTNANANANLNTSANTNTNANVGVGVGVPKWHNNVDAAAHSSAHLGAQSLVDLNSAAMLNGAGHPSFGPGPMAGSGSRPRLEMLQVTVPRVPGFGLGIAIAGGIDNPNHSTGDPAVIVSDVIRGGPADPKLRPNDRIVSVNGIALENVEHSFAARVLKECGSQATLVIRRAGNPTSGVPNGNAGLSTQPARSRLSYPPTVNMNGTPTSQLNPIAANSVPTAAPNASASLNSYNNSVLNMLDSSVNAFATPAATATAAPAPAPLGSSWNRRPNATGNVEQVVLHRSGGAPMNGLEIGCRFFVKRADADAFFGRLGIGDTLLRVGRVELDSPFLSADEVRRLVIDQSRSAESLTLLVERVSGNTSAADGSPPRPPLPAEYQHASRPLAASASVQMLSHNTPRAAQSAPVHRSMQLASRFSPNATSIRQAPGNYQAVAARYATSVGVRRGVLEKSAAGSFGVRLVGGNARGLFVASTQAGSSAATSGLLEGDRLLAIGQIDLVGPPKSTKEEALRALVNAPQRIEIAWTSDARGEYERLVSSGEFGDDLFVRVQFSATYRRNEVSVELRFNDVYHVVNTAHGGQLGTWFGAKVDSAMRESTRTELPNEEAASSLADRSRAELARSNLDGSGLSSSPFDSPERSGSGHHHNAFVNSSNAFFRRLKRVATTGNIHQLVSGSSTESIDAVGTAAQQAVRIRNAILTSSQLAAYERVEPRPADFVRPVVLFGPLNEVARDYLIRSLPAKYEAPRVDLAGSGDGDSALAMRVSAIREVTAKSKHCVLDVTLSAIDTLNRAELHPIVIFIKPATRQQIKDVRSQFPGRANSLHGAKWLFEFANALERECSFMFTSVVHLSNDDIWLKKLDDIVAQQQSQRVWFAFNSQARGLEPSPNQNLNPTTGAARPGLSGSQTLQRQPKANGAPRWNDDVDFGFSPAANSGTRMQNNNARAMQPAGGTLQSRSVAPPRTSQLDLSRPTNASVTRIPAPNRQALPNGQAPANFDAANASNARRNSDPAANANQSPLNASVPHDVQMTTSAYAYGGNGNGNQSATDRGAKTPGTTRHGQYGGEQAPMNNNGAFTQQIRIGNSNVTAPRQPLQPTPGRNYQPQSFVPNNTRGATAGYASQPDGAAKNAVTGDAAYYTNASTTQPFAPNAPDASSTQCDMAASGDSRRLSAIHEANQNVDCFEIEANGNQISDSASTNQSVNAASKSAGDDNIATATPSEAVIRPLGLLETNIDADPADAGTSALQIVATARGVFDAMGGLLEAPESGVSLLIPPGAIEDGTRIELYFNVFANGDHIPPLNQEAGEQLLSPLVVCGPRGVRFRKPVELRLPHRTDLDPAEWSFTLKSSDSFRDSNEQWRNVPLRTDSFRGEDANDSSGTIRPKHVSIYIDHF